MIPALWQATFFVFAIAAIAMPAGVGGGLLYVPILLLLHVVESGNDAAALSQPIMVGAALAGNLFNLADQCRRIRRHRQSEGAESGESPYLIDPRVVIILLTPCLAGVIMGAILNQLLPTFVILLLLVLVIIWSFISTMRKAIAMWKKESLAKAAGMAAAPTPRRWSRTPSLRSVGSGFGLGCIARSCSGGHSSSGDAAAVATREKSEDKALRAPASQMDSPCSQPSAASTSRAPPTPKAEVEKDEETGVHVDADTSNAAAAVAASDCAVNEGIAQPAARKPSIGAPSVGAPSGGASAVDWIKLVSVWVFLLIITALRGSKHGPSLVKTCSWGYWMISAVGVLTLLGVGVLLRHPKLATSKIVACGCLSAIAGIGGGLVLIPMMLKAGFDAPRTGANVSVVVLLNSASASFTFFMAGAFDPTSMAVLSTFSFFGSLLGKSILGWAIARTGRTSLLVFLLAAFMLMACCMVLTEGSIKLKDVIDDPSHRKEFFGFQRLCPQ